MKKALHIFISAFLLISCRSQKAPSGNEFNIEALNFFEEYEIASKTYGTITSVTIKDGERIIQTNALPNHETGAFPNSGNPNRISPQDRVYKLPLNPTLSGASRWAREPGVAVNGVKFEPETAERFVCETGEVYRIEAFQELLDLGLDFNHAHVQPTGAYHYHGVPMALIKWLDQGEDIIHVGFALDGFPIYYSKSGAYAPSYQLAEEKRTGEVCTYRNPKTQIIESLNNTVPDGTFVSDWEYVEGLGELDECNGTEVNGEYAYFVTDEYPYTSRCLKGEFTERRPKAPQGRHRHESRPPRKHD